jgi:hypothetical protein
VAAAGNQGKVGSSTITRHIDSDLLVEALRPDPVPVDLEIVIGMKGPIAPPELCNGLLAPIVVFDQIYSFDRDALIKAIPPPEKTSPEEFAPAAAELFDRIMQMTDNAGAMDEHRALNYLAVRYPAIYANAADAFARNSSLSAVDFRISPLSGTRKIVDIIFAYTNRNTDVTEKFFVRVDVTEEFPFMVTPSLGPIPFRRRAAGSAARSGRSRTRSWEWRLPHHWWPINDYV